MAINEMHFKKLQEQLERMKFGKTKTVDADVLIAELRAEVASTVFGSITRFRNFPFHGYIELRRLLCEAIWLNTDLGQIGRLNACIAIEREILEHVPFPKVTHPALFAVIEQAKTYMLMGKLGQNEGFERALQFLINQQQVAENVQVSLDKLQYQYRLGLAYTASRMGKEEHRLTEAYRLLKTVSDSWFVHRLLEKAANQGTDLSPGSDLQQSAG